MDIVLQAWQNKKLNYQGEFNQYEDLEVLPKPLQDPMPVWMAASSPDAIKWSAEKGFTIMMDPQM